MFRNTLRSTIKVANSTTTKAFTIDVRCLYDKSGDMFNQQISWVAKNISYGTFSDFNLKVIGWGNLNELFQLISYESDAFDEVRTSQLV